MKYTTKQPRNSETAAVTGFKAYLTIDFMTLCELFGDPNANHDEYKTDAEWHLWSKEGTIITIYNYKNGQNYLGNDGLDVLDIVDWHIGARAQHGVTDFIQSLAEVCTITTTNEDTPTYDVILNN